MRLGCSLVLECALLRSSYNTLTVLLAGQTKEEQPAAIRLYGRDVVIMSGPARMCYHGVPRVFRDDGTTDDDSIDADSEDAKYAAFAEHMRSTRINISIRATR